MRIGITLVLIALFAFFPLFISVNIYQFIACIMMICVFLITALAAGKYNHNNPRYKHINKRLIRSRTNYEWSNPMSTEGQIYNELRQGNRSKNR